MRNVLLIFGVLVSQILLAGSDIKVLVNNMELKDGDSHFFQFYKLDLQKKDQKISKFHLVVKKEKGGDIEVLDTIVTPLNNVFYFKEIFSTFPALFNRRDIVISDIMYESGKKERKKIKLSSPRSKDKQPSLKDVKAFNSITKNTSFLLHGNKITDQVSLTDFIKKPIIHVEADTQIESCEIMLVPVNRPIGRKKVLTTNELDFSSFFKIMKEGDHIMISKMAFSNKKGKAVKVFYLTK